MTDNSYGTPTRRLAATFSGRSQAQEAADVLVRNLQTARVDLTSQPKDRRVQYAEMRDELEGVVASPALGSAVTKSQAQGGVAGALIIGGVAVALGLTSGLLINGAPGSEISAIRWLITWVLVPAFAGGTFGFLSGGLLKQRYAPSRNDAAAPREAGPTAGLESPQPTVVEVASDDVEELERAYGILRDLAPDRLDRFTADGQVVATQDLGYRASN